MMAFAQASQSRALGSRSTSSLSIKSDDSDFDFGNWDSGKAELPASPRLHYTSVNWESSASGYIVSPARSSTSYAVYDAPLHVYGINESLIQQPVDAYSSLSRRTNFGGEEHDDVMADGAKITETSKTLSVKVGNVELKKKDKLGSLLQQRREIDRLPPLASARCSTVPSRSGKNSSGSSSSSSPLFSMDSFSPAHITSQSSKPSSRWSFRLDFLHSKKASSPDATDERQHVCGSERIDFKNRHDAALSRKSNCESSDLAGHYAFRGSPGSPVKADKKNAVRNGNQREGQSTKARSAPVSPSASPARAAGTVHHRGTAAQAAAAYGHATPRMSSPTSPRMDSPMSPRMSPHAQHYEHQRARAQELGRKTVLPYRQNFLASCFFSNESAIVSH